AEAGRRGDVEVAAHEQGVHRLEPEHRLQDDRRRVFTAREEPFALRVDARAVGRTGRCGKVARRGWARIFSGSRARASGVDRRPVRAGARKDAGASPGDHAGVRGAPRTDPAPRIVAREVPLHARLLEDERAVRRLLARSRTPAWKPAGKPPPVRRAETRRQSSALRLPPGDARSAQVVGRAEGTVLYERR